MPKIICELENASKKINGVKFVPHEDGIRLISEEDVKEPLASIFLSIPGYVVDEDDDGNENEQKPNPAPAAPAPKKETAAERKARLKAEQEAADKAEAERKAAEEAEAEAKAAAEREAAEKAAAEEAARKAAEDAGNGEGNDNEVF